MLLYDDRYLTSPQHNDSKQTSIFKAMWDNDKGRDDVRPLDPGRLPQGLGYYVRSYVADV